MMVKEVQSTLGVLGFQRPFIPGFADITKPLTNLLKKGMPFKWTNICTQAVQELKKIVTSEPVLIPPDQDKQFILEVNASQYTTGAILYQTMEQQDWQGRPILQPVGYHSQTFSAVKQ
jgi:hypothetical protein